MKTELADWSKKYAEDTAALKLDNALTLALADSGAIDKDIVKNLIDRSIASRLRSKGYSVDMISEAMCGVWLATQDDGIVLSCFGQPYDDIAHYSKYSEIDYQGRQKITKLICTNTETGKVSEMSTGEYGTVITINLPFVAAGTLLDGVVWNRLRNYVYQAWHCDKAILDGFIPASSRFYFGDFGDSDTMLLANNVTIDVDSTGIYFSGGCDPQDEEQWKYDDYTQRQLNNRLELDKTMGNIKVTKKTLKFVNHNKDSVSARSGETQKEEYGFNVFNGGITEYDGVMVSKVRAEEIAVPTSFNSSGKGGGSGGDYTLLDNKPSIGGKTIEGTMKLSDFGIVPFDKKYASLSNRPMYWSNMTSSFNGSDYYRVCKVRSDRR